MATVQRKTPQKISTMFAANSISPMTTYVAKTRTAIPIMR